jgi:hypothetical protein
MTVTTVKKKSVKLWFSLSKVRLAIKLVVMVGLAEWCLASLVEV